MSEPATLGGYTPEALAQEVRHRTLAQLQLEAAQQGAKLSARDRDAIGTGAVVGSSILFKILREVMAEEAGR